MDNRSGQFGILDSRFLSRSVGLLNPRAPLTVQETQSIKEVIELLQANKVGCVVVVDRAGKTVGIFSERDVVLKVSLAEMDLTKTPIAEVMTPNPKTIEMTAPIAFALNMMSHGGFRHIPVIDDDIPVGLVSVKDIVDYIVGSLTKDLSALG